MSNHVNVWDMMIFIQEVTGCWSELLNTVRVYCVREKMIMEPPHGTNADSHRRDDLVLNILLHHCGLSTHCPLVRIRHGLFSHNCCTVAALVMLLWTSNTPEKHRFYTFIPDCHLLATIPVLHSLYDVSSVHYKLKKSNDVLPQFAALWCLTVCMTIPMQSWLFQ